MLSSDFMHTTRGKWERCRLLGSGCIRGRLLIFRRTLPPSASCNIRSSHSPKTKADCLWCYMFILCACKLVNRGKLTKKWIKYVFEILSVINLNNMLLYACMLLIYDVSILIYFVISIIYFSIFSFVLCTSL